MIKFDSKTDSRKAKRKKVGLASQHPALITDKTNETEKKEEARSQFEITNQQKKRKEKKNCCLR